GTDPCARSSESIETTLDGVSESRSGRRDPTTATFSVNAAAESVISTGAEAFSGRRTTREKYPFASTRSEAGAGAPSGISSENLPSESVVAAAKSPAPSTRTIAPGTGRRAGSQTVPLTLEAAVADATTGKRSRRISESLPAGGAPDALERRSIRTRAVYWSWPEIAACLYTLKR